MNQQEFYNLCQELGLIGQQTLISHRLTAKYTGKLDFDSALAQKEHCWKKQDLRDLKTKKALVITSWYFDYLISFVQTQVMLFWDALIQNDFPVYLSTPKGLLALTGISMLKEHLPDLHSISLQETSRLAMETGINNDNLFVFDTNALLRLSRLQTLTKVERPFIKYTDPFPVATLTIDLSLSEITLLESKIQSGDQLHWYYNSVFMADLITSPALRNQITSIAIDRLSENDDAEARDLVQHFSQVNMLELRFASIKSDQLCHLLSFPELKYLSLSFIQAFFNSPVEFKPNHLISLVLRLPPASTSNPDITSANLTGLLNASPNLRYLEFNDLTQYTGGVIAPLNQMKKLHFANHVETNLIHSLLVAVSKKIKSIYINQVPNGISTILDYCRTEEGYEKLKNLKDLQFSNIKPADFIHIAPLLVSLENLHSLEITRCSNTNALFSSLLTHYQETGHNPLATLKVCYLATCDLDSEGLSALLTLAPALDALTIRSCKELKTDCESLTIPPGHLTFLNAEESTLTTNLLRTLVNAEPELSYLNVGNCEAIPFNDLRQLIPGLPYLGTLEAKYHEIPPDFLSTLREAAPELTLLNSAGFSMEYNNAGHAITASIYNLHTLIPILQTHQNLFHLLIGNYGSTKPYFPELTPLEPLRMHQLNSLAINNLVINFSQLNCLLQMTEKLHKLNILHLDIAAIGTIQPWPNSRLRSIELARITISTENMLALLQGATQLNTLMLSSITIVDNNSAPSHSSLSLPTLAKLHIYSNIQTKILDELLLAAPNLTCLDMCCVKFLNPDLPASDRPKLEKLITLRAPDSNISFQQLQSLLKIAPNLQSLILSDCNQFSQNELDWIRKNSPGVHLQHSYSKHLPHPNVSPTSRLQIDGRFYHDATTTFQPQIRFKGHPGTPTIPTLSYHLKAYVWSNRAQCLVPYHPQFRFMRRVQVPQLTLANLATRFENGKHISSERYNREDYSYLMNNEWYQLPATSTQDKLLAVGVPPDVEPIEFFHDTVSGYYFFRVLQDINQPLSLNYIIRSGQGTEATLANNQISLQNEIKTLRFNPQGHLIQTPEYERLTTQSHDILIKELLNFCTFPRASSANINGLFFELLNHTIVTQAGACRHRAQLFTVLAFELSIPVFYIVNELHAFVVAITDYDERITFNLGGAPCIVNESPFDETFFTSTPNQIAIQRQIRARAMQRRMPPALTNRFRVWNNAPLQAQCATDLMLELLTQSRQIKKRLLETVDYATIEALHEALLENPPASESTLFSSCLDAIQLQESALIDNVYQKVPTPLALFLEKAQEHPAQHFTWFINWSNARGAHTNLNCLIDNQEPKLNGSALPENLSLVILIDAPSARGMGDEFNSRLPLRSQVPGLQKPARPAEPTQALTEEDILLIQADEWTMELLGYFTMKEQAFLFSHGGLMEAIAQGKSAITIQNAPWQNPQFRWFERELRIGRKVYANGQEQALPPGFTIKYAKPAVINTIAAATMIAPLYATHLSLNQSTWLSFFKRTTLTDRGMNEINGLLEHYANTVIIFRVNENLHALQWFKIEQEARKHSINWAIQATPEIIIPGFLKNRIHQAKKITNTRQSTVIITNDLDYALHKELNSSREKSLTVIPVSPTTGFESLFISPWRDDKGHFFGHETTLLQAIRGGESICFFGKFSAGLINRMASLFSSHRVLTVNGEIIPVTGAIRLISDEPSLFKAFDYEQRNFQPNETQLSPLYTQFKITPCFSHFNQNPDELERQLYILANQPQPVTMPQSSSSVQVIDKPTEPADLLNALERYPFVFLMGETGTGKTWLMTKALPAYAKKMGLDITVCFNLANIKQWLAKREGTVILFMDEANLSDEVYHLFENLARGERVIWLDGQRFELTPGQKVAFASNHPSYGGRKQDELFKRYLYFINFRGQGLEQILQPLLNRFFDNPATHLAEINHWYYQAKNAGLTITPRNAEMICLHAFALKKNHPYFPESLLFKFAIMTALKGLNFNPEKTRELRHQLKQTPEWQDRAKTLKNHLADKLPKTSTKDFIWTPSRQKIALIVLALLRIRQHKIDGIHDQGLGINGLVLEGMPGLGKSKLLVAILNELKIPFIILSTDPNEAREQLIRAFHQGLVVIIDELNTYPHEQLLNDLLSNLDPEKQPATKKGFCILATQNPATFKKRDILSKALDNRLITLTLKEYTVEELQEILELSYEMSAQEASALIEEWQEAKDYAQQENVLKPDTRTLFIEAEKRVAAAREDVRARCSIL